MSNPNDKRAVAIERAAADLSSIFMVISKASLHKMPDGGDGVWPTFELDGAGSGLIAVAATLFERHMRMSYGDIAEEAIARAREHEMQAMQSTMAGAMGVVDVDPPNVGGIGAELGAYLSRMQAAIGSLTPEQLAIVEKIGAMGGADPAPLDDDQT